jgi:hypothetical protein
MEKRINLKRHGKDLSGNMIDKNLVQQAKYSKRSS